MENCLLLFIVIWVFSVMMAGGNGREISTESAEDKMDEFYSTMGPNSKFLNPFFDEATNLKLALADDYSPSSFENSYEVDFENIPLKPIEFRSEKQSEEESRIAKNLKHWNTLSLLNSLISKRSKSA